MAIKIVWRITLDETGTVTIEREKVQTQTVSDTIEDLIEDINTEVKAAKAT